MLRVFVAKQRERKEKELTFFLRTDLSARWMKNTHVLSQRIYNGGLWENMF